MKALATAAICLTLAWTAPAYAGPALESEISQGKYTIQTMNIIQEGAEISERPGEEPKGTGHINGTVEAVVELSDEENTMITTQDGVAYIKTKDISIHPAAGADPNQEEQTGAAEQGRKLRSLGQFKLTYYDPHACCATGNGVTASGRKAVVGRTIAMSKKYAALGTHVLINGHEYVVDDRGVTGRTVDVLVPDHKTALRMGVDYAEVFVIE